MDSLYAISEITITINTPSSAIVGIHISAQLFYLSVGSSVPSDDAVVTFISGGLVTDETPTRLRDYW